MKSISKEEIKKLNDNAHFFLNEKEVDELYIYFQELINDFDELININTDGVEPTFFPVNNECKLREDIPAEENKNINYFSNSIKIENSFVVIKNEK